MSNPLSEIYETVFNQIIAIGPKKYWIALDIGQLERDGVALPIQYPAVLLKFEDVVWKFLDSTLHYGVVNVTVKYVHRFTNESELIQGEQPSGEVLQCLEDLQQIHEELHNLSGESFSQMKRFNQYYRKTNPKKLLWVNVLQYQCNIRSDGTYDGSTTLLIDYDDIRNNNAFLDRKKFNYIHK